MVDDFERMDQIQIKILNNTVDLDHPCWQCVEYHSGWDDGPSRVYKFKAGYEAGQHCDVCNNTRFILNESGEAIIALVKRHHHRS